MLKADINIIPVDEPVLLLGLEFLALLKSTLLSSFKAISSCLCDHWRCTNCGNAACYVHKWHKCHPMFSIWHNLCVTAFSPSDPTV